MSSEPKKRPVHRQRYYADLYDQPDGVCWEADEPCERCRAVLLVNPQHLMQPKAPFDYVCHCGLVIMFSPAPELSEAPPQAPGGNP